MSNGVRGENSVVHGLTPSFATIKALVETRFKITVHRVRLCFENEDGGKIRAEVMVLLTGYGWIQGGGKTLNDATKNCMDEIGKLESFQ